MDGFQHIIHSGAGISLPRVKLLPLSPDDVVKNMVVLWTFCTFRYSDSTSKGLKGGNRTCCTLHFVLLGRNV